MASGPIGERVYQELKRAVLRGEFRQAYPVTTQWLVDRFGASLIPLREAIKRLEGEGLVLFAPRQGFRVLSLDAIALRERYALNLGILKLSIAKVRTENGWLRIREAAHRPSASDTAEDLIDAVAHLFTVMGEAAPSDEYGLFIRSLNDRLYAARLAEARIRREFRLEIQAVREAVGNGDKGAIRNQLVKYHRARIAQASIYAEMVQSWAQN